MKYATCHPDRPHGAKGLCRSCYDKKNWAENKEKLSEKNKKYHKNNIEKVKARHAANYYRDVAAGRERSAVWRKLNPQKSRDKVRKSRLKREFGITPEDYEKMLSNQGGVCEICSKECPSGRRLAVDHNHETRQVRGLLCTLCNQAIGQARESAEILQAMIRYLKKYSDRAALP